jgi:excisionase family DNA binding protein
VTDPRLALTGEPPALTVARASELLGLPESEIRRLIAAGTFPVVAVGERLMVLARSLERWAADAGEAHRAASVVARERHALDDPAHAADGVVPCPNCGAPLDPVANYVSVRHGRLLVCPYSPTYYAMVGKRPMRVYDMVAVEPERAADAG